MHSEDERKRFNSVFAAVMIYMAVSAAAGLLMSFLQLRVDAVSALMEKRQVLLNGIVNILVFFPMALVLFGRLPSDEPRGAARLSAKDMFRLFTLCYACMFIGSYISNVFLNVFNIGGDNYIVDMIVNTGKLESLLFIVIIAPITEEIIFRKLISDRLLFMGEKTAAFMSALIFAMMHGNFFQFFYAFTVGYVFAVIYIKTGRIAYTAAIHVIINFMGSVVAVWIMKLGQSAQLVYSLLLMLIAVTGLFNLVKFAGKCRLADRDDRRLCSFSQLGFVLGCPAFVLFIAAGLLLTFLRTG